MRTIFDSGDPSLAAGLTFASLETPGLTRHRAGRGFSYRTPAGGRVVDRAVLSRIRSLAIPPAWTQVWICPNPDGHIQAVGFDEKGRRQYRYHPAFREIREGEKFEHMMAFAEGLPALRRQIALDRAKPGLGREKVLATVVDLLETTLIRVGNRTYARENKSYGLTTLLSRHVTVEGPELRFSFRGKSGKTWRLSVRDRRVARTVRSCQELPGQHLFQYLDEAGEPRCITSSDVNAYLKQASGADISAKDFRTWAGTVMAATALNELGAADDVSRARRNVTRAIEQVASRLGNTPAICRRCYVHPEIISAYLDGELRLPEAKGPVRQRAPDVEPLRPDEASVFAFLRQRRRKSAKCDSEIRALAAVGRE